CSTWPVLWRSSPLRRRGLTFAGTKPGLAEFEIRQNHDFEIKMGIIDWWMISTTLGTVVPEGSSWLVEDVELETQFFCPRLWLGHAARYGQRDRVRFDRGVRRRRVPADHEHALQPQMFGEIEDLSNPGSFNDQNHRIGPTLFWKPGGGDEDEEAGDVGEGD